MWVIGQIEIGWAEISVAGVAMAGAIAAIWARMIKRDQRIDDRFDEEITARTKEMAEHNAATRASDKAHFAEVLQIMTDAAVANESQTSILRSLAVAVEDLRTTTNELRERLEHAHGKPEGE